MGKRREKKRKRFQQELEEASLPSTGLEQKDPSSLPFSTAELGACLKVIRLIVDDEKLLQHSNLRELRKVLDPLVQRRVEKYVPSEGQPPLKRQKTRKEAKDADAINSTKLRAERMKHLEKLNEEGKEDVLRVLDGVGFTHTPNSMLLTNGTGDQLQLPAGEDVTITDITEEEIANREEKFVQTALKCYTCKTKFKKLHFYYDQLCPPCADLNYRKRTETVDMKGKVCFVTGARVKIGYRCALKLLRCGSVVIATTRFPADAARRYENEDDFSTWGHNLHLFGLDFRNVAALEGFCAFIKQRYSRLDVIINNACQTIRRPPAFYQHLLQNEKENSTADSVSPSTLPLLRQHFEMVEEFTTNKCSATIESSGSNEDFIIEEVNENLETIASSTPLPSRSTSTPCPGGNNTTVSASSGAPLTSAEMSQIELVPGDNNYSTALFPTQATDVNDQQVDLRTKNSWMLKLDEVSTPELAEVMLINAMAPTIINSKLKPLMEIDPETPKFIVNVSAMEGKFYRYKSDTHPHTNMAKAALNMMTRTCAQDYKKKNIYMTAVDTGWINDEKPLVIAVQHMKQHNFQTPLDEIDAAARVLDPVIAPLLDLAQGRKFDPPWGIFLKDYIKCEW